MSSKRRLAKVTSLRDLRLRAATDDDYRALAIAAAANLGGGARVGNDFEKAMAWLGTNADVTTERGVVAEVNYCRTTLFVNACLSEKGEPKTNG